MIESSLGGLIEASEVDAFRAAIQQHSPRAIRIRSDRQSSLDSFNSLEAVPWYAPGRLVRSQQGRPSQSLHYAAADYYIQDAGSMLALALLDAQPHEVICDLCAAPGGKASGIGERLDEGGFLLANEPIASRIAILRFAMARTGNPRYAVTQQDPALIASRFAGCFDAVLVDAPCSGQAMVAKGKRDDNAFDQRQIEHSARRQRRILLEACKLLRVGGRLIYSTCTFAVEENEMQLRFLREQFPDAWEPIDSPGLRPWASRIEPGCYRVWPHRDPTSGAFAGGLKLVDSIASRLGPLDHLARPRTRSSSAKSPKRFTYPTEGGAGKLRTTSANTRLGDRIELDCRIGRRYSQKLAGVARRARVAFTGDGPCRHQQTRLRPCHARPDMVRAVEKRRAGRFRGSKISGWRSPFSIRFSEPIGQFGRRNSWRGALGPMGGRCLEAKTAGMGQVYGPKGQQPPPKARKAFYRNGGRIRSLILPICR